MRLLIPDASVILKWVLPPEHEPGVQDAVAILERFVAGEIELVVPSLWYYEVGNTVARLVPNDAGEYLDQLRHLGMAEVGAASAIELRALAFVRRFGVTFYDAVYHAVAAELDGTLVTADRRYIARVGNDPAVVDLHKISKA